MLLNGTLLVVILLIGAIALDAIAFIMALSSDWTAVMLANNNNNILIKCFGSILRICRDKWPLEKTTEPTSCLAMVMEFMAKILGYKKLRKIIHRRWSETIPQYNLIHYCLNQRSVWLQKPIGWFGLTNMADNIQYVTNKKFNDEIRELIFDELKMKSQVADDSETFQEINAARGDWILRVHHKYDLFPWVNDVDFDESLLLWHVATDLLYNYDEEDRDEPRKMMFRRSAKPISDYMLYLLMMQPAMMSTVAGIGEIRFRDTCAEAKVFFERRLIERETGGIPHDGKEKKKQDQEDETPDKSHIMACQRLLWVHTAVKPVAIKGDTSKSVLFDACMLAKQLQGLDKEVWKIMSQVWAEFLFYAASRCRPSMHAARLSKGGELLTIVWLLMTHFGLGSQFQISDGHVMGKLIVEQ